MSGVSQAVSGGGIEAEKRQEHGSMTMMGSLRVIELQLVAFVLVFSASGLVPLLDLLFPLFVSFYLLTLSHFTFPSYHRGLSQNIFHGSKLFQLYVIVGTTVGLFLPLAYVLGGFGRGDKLAVRSASPHLFFISFQILTENIVSGLSMFSPPVRALVPLIYTVRRIFVDINWIHDVWLNITLPENAPLKVIFISSNYVDMYFWSYLILTQHHAIIFKLHKTNILILFP